MESRNKNKLSKLTNRRMDLAFTGSKYSDLSELAH